MEKIKNEVYELLNKDVEKLEKSLKLNLGIENKDQVVENIESLIKERYSLVDFSSMEEEIGHIYDDFKAKFSPEKLFTISDSELPKYMFYSEKSNQDNMCWNLEFNPKVKQYMGAIGGGTAYLYGLHYSRKHNSWLTGTGMKPIKLTEEEAIQRAIEIRKMLSDAVDVVKKYENTKDINDYTLMHAEIMETCDNLANKLWFVKYLHMIYPKMFSTYFNEVWQRFLLSKCGLTQHDDIYERSGELALLGQRVEIENAVVSKILFDIFGYPKTETENQTEEMEEQGDFNMLERKPRESKIHNFNTIMFGAPGTGKTYSTVEYANSIIENRKTNYSQLSDEERKELKNTYNKYVKEGKIYFTTFHQSYGYEDFIQGLRPTTNENGSMEFIPVDGVFKKIAEKAMIDNENNYVIIIDEINRGNISKIFGELITLIEEDKRWGEKEQLSVILPSGEEFAVPNNLYIIGTMNSADKSIALIDTALRRRFDFVEIAPNPSVIDNDVLRGVLERLNDVLRKQLDTTDLLIGHAYFIGKDESELANILNRNIIPLLYEYFYDNEKKVKDALSKAIEGTGVRITETNQTRIKVE